MTVLPDDLKMISVIKNTFFANARYWGGLNQSFFSSGNLFAINTGIDSADLNMAWNEIPLAASDRDDIKSIEDYFKRKSLPFWWWLFPSTSASSCAEILAQNGFASVMSIPSMAAELTTSPYQTETSKSITVHQVNSLHDLAVWEEISFSGFEFPDKTKQQYRRFTGTFNLDARSPQKFFLAFFNGKPVATALLFLHKDVAGLYFVTTLHDFRKKGIGLDLTHAVMRFARQAGSRYISLQSSPDGFRIYQEAGFREYCRAEVYAPTT